LHHRGGTLTVSPFAGKSEHALERTTVTA